MVPGRGGESRSAPSSPSANGKTRHDAPNGTASRTRSRAPLTPENVGASHERRSVSDPATAPSPNGDQRGEQGDVVDDIYADVRKQLHDSAMERFQQIFEYWEEQRGCKHVPRCSPSRRPGRLAGLELDK